MSLLELLTHENLHNYHQTSAYKVNGILVPMRIPYNLEQDVQTSVGAPYVSM